MSPISYHTGSNIIPTMTGPINVYILVYAPMTSGTTSTYFTPTRTSLITSFINSLSSSAYFGIAKKYNVGNFQVAKVVYQDCSTQGNNQYSYGCYIGPDIVDLLLWYQIFQVWDDFYAGQLQAPQQSVYVPGPNGWGFANDPNGLYLLMLSPDQEEAYNNAGNGIRVGYQYCGYGR